MVEANQPEERTVQMQIYTTATLKQRARLAAARAGCTVSEWGHRLIERELGAVQDSQDSQENHDNGTQPRQDG